MLLGMSTGLIFFRVGIRFGTEDRDMVVVGRHFAFLLIVV